MNKQRPPRPQRPGAAGENVFMVKGLILYSFPIIVLYALLALISFFWALSCPPLDREKRVLRTGSIHVDALLATLVPSLFLTPAAVLVRKMSNELSLLHTFAVPSERPVKVAHLDAIASSGVLSLPSLFNYSRYRAIIQGILLLTGTILVPVGTLTVTTGFHAGDARGEALVGAPLKFTNNTLTASVTRNSLMDELYASVKGSLVDRNGIVESMAPVLGPRQTLNLTYQDGVRYEGVVTFSWQSNCQYDQLHRKLKYRQFEKDSLPYVEFTFPGGRVWSRRALPTPNLFFDTDGPTNNKGVPMGGSTYITVWASTTTSSNSSININNDELRSQIANGSWVSQVVCRPSMTWQLSSCSWNGASMEKCIHQTGVDDRFLDKIGLDYLSNYMTAIPWYFYNSTDFLYQIPTVLVPLVHLPGTSSQYRAPTLADYNNLYGLIANAIASVTTSGNYGTTTTPTIGESEKVVYVDRLWFHGAVVVLLVATSIGVATDIGLHIKNKLPFRRATFLAVACAVRGKWWDRQLYGGCVLDEKELRRRAGGDVLFGVDANATSHVGFAPVVYNISKKEIYYGVLEEDSS